MYYIAVTHLHPSPNLISLQKAEAKEETKEK
jgi:hypothetical protein